MAQLPENIDATYADDANDPSAKLHQQFHDSLHTLNNRIEAAVLAAAAGQSIRRAATGTAFEAYTPELPWLVDIAAGMATAHAHLNWDSMVANSGSLLGGWMQSSGAQNDMIAWDVVMSAGTWSAEVLHYGDINRGIYSVRLDGTEVAAMDGYRAAGTPNVRSLVTGIAVATAGKRRLSVVMASKNASSGGFFGTLQAVRLLRTA